jgi:RNA polymerase sigma-70 factor (ECF subfamily)
MAELDSLVSPFDEGPADRDLVIRARAGSRAAFERLVRRHQRHLYFLCLRYVHDHDVAADLTQRAFIRALEGIVSLRDAGSFRGWLFATAVNMARNHRRDNAKFVREDILIEPTIDPDVEGRLESGEVASSLRQAVDGLSPKQRSVVELRIYDELSFAEIGRELRMTPNAARVNFHFAVRKLRRRFARPSSELAA